MTGRDPPAPLGAEVVLLVDESEAAYAVALTMLPRRKPWRVDFGEWQACGGPPAAIAERVLDKFQRIGVVASDGTVNSTILAYARRLALARLAPRGRSKP